MKKSHKFPNAIICKKIHYFPADIKPSNVHPDKPFEIQAVYFQGKWYQDTFYITAEFADQLKTF